MLNEWIICSLLGLLMMGSTFATGCSSDPVEPDDVDLRDSQNDARSLQDFEALSDENHRRYADDKLGDTHVSELGDQSLVLHGVRDLRSGEAAVLSQFEGSALYFPDLNHLDPASASALSEWGDESAKLEFLALENLDENAALALVGWQGKRLGFQGFKHLDDATARALGEWIGDELALNGLTAIDPSVASELIRAPSSTLELNAVEQLDVSTAEVLADFRGDHLKLTGLTSIDDDVADALEQFDGTVALKSGDLEN